jgi:hypothetical protein
LAFGLLLLGWLPVGSDAATVLTTYAVTITTIARPEVAFGSLVDLASDWLAVAYPIDERPSGVRVRVREDDASPVWRAIIEETAAPERPAANGSVTTTTVSIVGGSGRCVLDVRRAQQPRRAIVAPVPVEAVPPAALRALVIDALERIDARDAHRPVRSTAEPVGDAGAAHALAAFADAPGRQLPLLVECLDAALPGDFGAARAARPLAGLAHVAVVTTLEAVVGFNEMRGERLLVPGALVLIWPGGALAEVRLRREMGATAAPQALARLTRLVIETAARALPAPRLPGVNAKARPIGGDDRPPSAPAPGRSPMVTGPALAPPEDPTVRERVASLEADLDAALEEVESLEAALAGADRMIEEKQALVEEQHGLVDRLVAQNVDLAIRLGHAPRGLTATSAADAVIKARDGCAHLTFHPRAEASAAHLHIADPTRILVDLHRLDLVAADWQTGAVGTNLFPLACRNVGLDFAPDISDTAKHRYAEDYAIEWRGAVVYARAHLRRGKGTQLYRIHIYLDLGTRQVVVAYVGRHLRDKRSA